MAINIEALTKRFELRGSELAIGDTHLLALNEVSFQILEGGCVGLIGPNGSGKSTLLQLLSGILKPTSGRIELRGRVASILDVGAGFHLELSGRENVYLYGQLLGFKRSEIRQVYDRIVEFSGVKQFIDQPVKHYSNGMYLRLAFSTVVFLDFDIYLLDEVLGVGDSAFRLQMKSLFHDNEWRGNRTFLISSHNHTELIFTTEKVIELDKGRLISYGNSDEVIRAYERKRLTNISKGGRFEKYFRELELHLKVNDRPVDSMLNSDELEVNIRAERVLDTTCQIGVVVKDVFGNVVFTVSPIQSGISLKDVKGRFNLKMCVPSRFFNQGTFYFHLSGFNDDGNVFETGILASIDVEPEQLLLSYHEGRTLGAVKPFFNWVLE